MVRHQLLSMRTYGYGSHFHDRDLRLWSLPPLNERSHQEAGQDERDANRYQ